MTIKRWVRPGTGIRVIDGRIDIAEIDFAHKSIDVKLSGEAGKSRLTINAREDM
jgi:hypothetical protein